MYLHKLHVSLYLTVTKQYRLYRGIYVYICIYTLLPICGQEIFTQHKNIYKTFKNIL